MTAGERLKARRDALGMSLIGLERASGVSRHHIKKLESVDTAFATAKTKTLTALATALDTTVSDLFF